MVEIVYNTEKINVPESWDDITLGVYEKFHRNKPQNMRERVAQLAEVCSIDAEILLAWPADIFARIVTITGFIFADDDTQPSTIVEADGIIYVVPVEDQLTLGAFVDADDVQKNSDAILSNMLAIVCRPVGEAYDHHNNEARAAVFAALPVSRVLGVLAFFLQCSQISKKRTEAYLQIKSLADQLPQNIKSLLQLTGGIRLLPILPTIRYLISMRLLKNQLRRFSRSYNIS